MASISNIFSRARARMSLSQSELAERVGCDRSFISHLESGRVSVSFKMAGRIAQVLDLTETEKAKILDLAAGEEVADV